jgi:hypothetical protein
MLMRLCSRMPEPRGNADRGSPEENGRRLVSVDGFADPHQDRNECLLQFRTLICYILCPNETTIHADLHDCF